jgi:uncharacterized protein YbaP (TraB family)
VVVHANPGPPIWRVTKGEASVYLFGIADPMPADLAWNTAGIADALKGARQLLSRERASVGLAEGLWFLTWHSNSIYLPGDTPMESTLPADLRARFAGVRASIRRDADRYAALRAPLAALRLEGDVLQTQKLTREEPAATIEKIARKLGVPSRPIAEYEALPLLRKLDTMSKAQNEACARDALDDIDALKAHAAPAAKAWAGGDLEAMKAAYSEERFLSCIQAVPGAADLFARAVRDTLAAVHEALAKPGKTVIVVAAPTILKRGGLIDKLLAEGLKVEQV